MNFDQFFYKRYVRKFFIYTSFTSILVIFPYIILYIIIDPLQIFHKSWFQNDRLNGSMREQAAGIINNFDFDSIILGTSVLENTSAREASEKIGGHFFNISIPGSTIFERSIVLRRALRKHLKNVIYSLDDTSLTYTQNNIIYPAYHWSFLYDDNIFNDFKIYATKKYVRHYSPLFDTRTVDMDRPNAWYSIVTNSVRFGGIEKWVENIEHPEVKKFLTKDLYLSAYESQNKVAMLPDVTSEYQLNVKKYFEDSLLKYAKIYDNTQFYLIIPPYFRYRYAHWRQNHPIFFAQYQYIIRYLVMETSGLSNVHIFGFEDQNFLDDISNYKDVVHYHHRFNSYFLDAIAHGKHKLTPENLEEYLKKCDKLAYDFDIMKLYNDVQTLLAKRQSTQKQ